MPHFAPFTAGSRRSRWGAAALAVLALGMAGCSGSASSSATAGGLDDGLGSRAENRTVDFFTYYDPSADAFWKQILTGAEDAASLTGLKIEAQTASGDTGKMTDLISAAIAKKPAAIVVSFNDPSWESAACEASKAGIPVFAYNVPPSETAADCVVSFVGQDFRAVGSIIGQSLVDQVDIGSGDKVLCPAEEPDQQYAIQRGGGVDDVLKKLGTKCTFLRTSGDDGQALDAMTTWLTANQDVKAIVPLGGTPHRNAVAAQDAAGVKVPIIGFDTSPQVVDGIKSGRILASADQQGYVQGFQPVLEVAQLIDFGISPADMNSGGNGLITKDNVSNLEDPDLEGIRY
ncbi:substrate-binding domain-containing protein [Nocardioides acrostichi]|uniref:Substrate-binding domain-containing protein n=1 Tax=Nocardioides acrostichi TaxID=2784339 RepID=A0A930V3X9_9ACTN|nr:substrate-binding domain-containing protein [Nocardioides acrostichi]MBF4163367.1 substrate-binding domain-containing protein [Nocardioides acrostichi]